MVIKVQGGRIRVDDTEPRVIKIGGVGPQGPTGPTGVVGATAPVVYSSQTVSLTTDQANGVPVLDANGKLKTAQLPAMSISDTFVVASQAAMLALTAEVGDVAVRTDLSKSLILTASPASTLGNWQELLTPPDTVLSVNDKVGAVQLEAADVDALDATDPSITNSRHPVWQYVVWGTNADYTLDTTVSTIVRQSATLTAPRTITLPDVNTLEGDGIEIIVHTGSSVSSTNTVTVAPASGQTINGSASGQVIAAANAQRRFIYAASNGWVMDSGVLRTSANLSDLASASTARTNLGLGSLATKSTIASADITDGTIVNADVNASAAIADSKLSLTTTVSGTAISASNKITDQSALSTATNLGQPGILLPINTPFATGTQGFSADGQYRGFRFQLTQPLTVTKLAYHITTAATVSGGGADTAATLDIAIYNSAGNSKLFSTGAISNTAYVASTTTGIVSGTSSCGSTGVKVIGLASSWALSAATTYYIVLHFGTMASGGGRPSVAAVGNSAYEGQLFGASFGNAVSVAASPGGTTAPASISLGNTSYPIIALRTD